jgi:hypothetical protein
VTDPAVKEKTKETVMGWEMNCSISMASFNNQISSNMVWVLPQILVLQRSGTKT